MTSTVSNAMVWTGKNARFPRPDPTARVRHRMPGRSACTGDRRVRLVGRASFGPADQRASGRMLGAGGGRVRPAGRHASGPAEYRVGPSVSRAEHPMVADRSVGAAGLVTAGLLTGAIVVGLIGVAHWRAGDPAPAPIPTPVSRPHDGGPR